MDKEKKVYFDGMELPDDPSEFRLDQRLEESRTLLSSAITEITEFVEHEQCTFTFYCERMAEAIRGIFQRMEDGK